MGMRGFRVLLWLSYRPSSVPPVLEGGYKSWVSEKYFQILLSKGEVRVHFNTE